MWSNRFVSPLVQDNQHIQFRYAPANHVIYDDIQCLKWSLKDCRSVAAYEAQFYSLLYSLQNYSSPVVIYGVTRPSAFLTQTKFLILSRKKTTQSKLLIISRKNQPHQTCYTFPKKPTTQVRLKKPITRPTKFLKTSLKK